MIRTQAAPKCRIILYVNLNIIPINKKCHEQGPLNIDVITPRLDAPKHVTIMSEETYPITNLNEEIRIVIKICTVMKMDIVMKVHIVKMKKVAIMKMKKVATIKRKKSAAMTTKKIATMTNKEDGNQDDKEDDDYDLCEELDRLLHLISIEEKKKSYRLKIDYGVYKSFRRRKNKEMCNLHHQVTFIGAISVGVGSKKVHVKFDHSHLGNIPYRGRLL